MASAGCKLALSEPEGVNHELEDMVIKEVTVGISR